MSTGYTAAIADGITFEQFVWGCARAFSALIMMRDEPPDAEIPREFQISTYHAEALVKARQRFEELGAMTPDEVKTAAENGFREEVRAREERITKSADLRRKYETMLAAVTAWQPPTPDHVGLKEFMESQIAESIKWDCDIPRTQLHKPTPDEWLATALGKTLSDITYHEKANAEEIARTKSRNTWLRQLRESLVETP